MFFKVHTCALHQEIIVNQEITIEQRDEEIARLIRHAEFIERQLVIRNRQLEQQVETLTAASNTDNPSVSGGGIGGGSGNGSGIPTTPAPPDMDSDDDDESDNDPNDENTDHAEWFSEKKRE